MRVILFVLCFLFLASNVWAKELITYAHLTNDTWQIWVMDPDGQNKRQVTFSAQDKRDPTWVNGGQKIAFRTSNSQLFTVDSDGKNEQEILKKYGVVTNPCFSRVTNEIVFIRFDPRGKDRADIWKSDLTGEHSKLLTKDQTGRFQPRFSPLGDKIAFVQKDREDPDYHIWMMNADGSDPRQLTTGKGFDTHPDFSPDQTVITFSSNRNENNYEVYSLELKTMTIKQLTHYSGLDTQSRFSSDGKKIVFVSNRSGDQQIWAMNTDGSDPVALTHENTESIDPAWGKIE